MSISPTTDNILPRLEEIIRDVFNDPDLTVTTNLTTEDVEAWDSLGHARIIFAVEEDFGIKFTIEEIGAIDTVGVLAEMIAAKSATA